MWREVEWGGGGVVSCPKPISNHTRCLARLRGPTSFRGSWWHLDQNFTDTGLRVVEIVPQE